ncbi:MAG: methyltransferase [Alphaproteobacteria bacterium]|jgi:predicted methyltransferase|uniref:Class I SAM-dependent methyltransferase n=4 Tax=Brevundimonas TaxID=41275 RepID=A0A6G7EIJ5_9CAUL|nr:MULTISPECIES: class I SAM-dependent methyltransferase [Brevundimonas]MBU4196740.1 methyltransferase [Alphaproteobacteria bacterium]EDX80496.1 Tat pathway signal sequence domain protein [Brevundimonas sp. BAL3]MBA4331685.1 methyltransferase [Brevundimonas sp.]MBB3872371.1 putative methyltransferase [Brevundimonas mediterranea]MCG2663333.1 class I SAM-dependent methyltransferase [Brevundimonas sp.]
MAALSAISSDPSRRFLLSGAAALALIAVAGCGPKKEEAPEAPPAPAGPPEGSLEWAVAGPWRAQDRPRDAFRHPMETLRFFGLQPRMTVVEFWPGSGWYTEILAPYLTRGQGTYIAALFPEGPTADPAQAALNAAFQTRFSADKKLYGEPQFTTFGAASGPVAPAGTADLCLFMRTLHGWMAAGIAEKAFSDAFAALKPGGVLGVEQHRLAPEEDQDPVAANGYVQEAFVRQLAAEAGFVFVAASEVNANEKDTKDHPFGVDTLPPTRLTAPRGDPADPAFDRSKYEEIGESDRMTLKFRKPE